MREISTTTVSGTSPGQIIGLGCLRTAGVRSTGKSVSAYLAVESGSFASSQRVASVSSVGAASGVHRGASRFALRVERSPVSVSVVARLRPHRVGRASVGGQPSPVELLAKSLRVASVRVASVCVASVRVASSPVASSCVRGVSEVGCVESPRQVLRRVFERLAETSRGGVSRRLSRRFGRVDRVGSSLLHDSCVASAVVASRPAEQLGCRDLSPVEWLRPVAFPAGPRRFH